MYFVLHPAAQSDGQLTPAEQRPSIPPNEVLGLRAPDDGGPDKQLHVILPVTRSRIVFGRSNAGLLSDPGEESTFTTWQ